VNLAHEGLHLWYGTPDAPVPFDGEVVPRRGASLVLGVHPSNPTNSVVVQYRVDGGIVRTVPGRELRNDYSRNVQYFVAVFPPFPTGDLVEYTPIFRCGGRQVPPPHVSERFRSGFRLERKPGSRS
jgi:hypothetical protein